jgi:uncharacterized protein (TIGR02598 family)
VRPVCHPQPTPKQGSPPGFSLVEITLALAIFAFAIVAILGLIPVGLDVFRASTSDNIESEIVQQILRGAQQSPFYDTTGSSQRDVLKEQFDNKSFYYDVEGRQLTSAQEAVFIANVSILDAVVDWDGNVTSTDLEKMDRKGVTGETQQVLRRVRVVIQSRMRATTHTFSANIADLGISR